MDSTARQFIAGTCTCTVAVTWPAGPPAAGFHTCDADRHRQHDAVAAMAMMAAMNMTVMMFVFMSMAVIVVIVDMVTIMIMTIVMSQRKNMYGVEPN